MITWKAELLADLHLQLGEGAYWHNSWGKFLFVDIKGKKTGAINPETKAVSVKNLDKMIGMVAESASDQLIIALQGSIEELDFYTGVRRVLTYIEPEKFNNRCNDGACDAKGRLWIGTMHKNALLSEGARYYYDGSIERVIPDTSVSNGICWSADNQTMYFIDSFEYDVKAYDFDLQTGAITNKRVAVKVLEDKNAMPDGMCIDAEGMLWVAIWGGGCVNRYNPKNGELIGRVTVPAPNVTSCALGGKSLKQLMITTASDGLIKGDLDRFPNSGGLFIANVDTAGILPHKFKQSSCLK